MMNQIKVLVFPVGQSPVVQKIQGNLEEMKEIVGGWVQALNLGTLTFNEELIGFDLHCNEEGRREELPFNKLFPHDYIVGQFFISKAGVKGELVSLTDADIELIKKTIEEVTHIGIENLLNNTFK